MYHHPSGPHHGDHHLHAGGGQRPVQCRWDDPQDLLLQDDRLLPPVQPQHHHPGHGLPHLHDGSYTGRLCPQSRWHGSGKGSASDCVLFLWCINTLLEFQIKSIAQERVSSGDPKNNFMNKFFTEGNIYFQNNYFRSFSELWFIWRLIVVGGEPVDKLQDANRINKQGQILFVLGFVLFQIIFWSVALAEFMPE